MKISAIFYLVVFTAIAGTSQAQSYQKPGLSDNRSWSMIMLPDPQTYVKFARNQPIFDLMTAWVQENIDSLKITAVVCTGDLVEQNEMPVPDGINGNQDSRSQWKAVSGAFNRLDGRVPYIVAAGNHDYGYKNVSFRRSNLNEFFPPSKNILNQKTLKETGINAEGYPTLENAAYEISSPGGKKYLILSIEFAPRDTILTWASQLISRPVYKNHVVILLTHSYLAANNQRIVKENYPVVGNYGEAIWKKLVAPSSNIQLVLSGHICEPDDIKAHIGFRTDKNAAGKTVNQMAFNAQALGGGWHGNGGDGWLRILEFLPDERTVKVKTFSPFFAISPTTQQFAWRNDPWDQFVFTFD